MSTPFEQRPKPTDEFFGQESQREKDEAAFASLRCRAGIDKSDVALLQSPYVNTDQVLLVLVLLHLSHVDAAITALHVLLTEAYSEDWLNLAGGQPGG